jgi:hypothetical protein
MKESSGSSRPCGLWRCPWNIGYYSVSMSTSGVGNSTLVHIVWERAQEVVEKCHVVLSCCVMADTWSNTALSVWISPVIFSTACITVV